MSGTVECKGCGGLFFAQESWTEDRDDGATVTVVSNAAVAGICDGCARRIPWSLIKAAGDTFDYALRLRTGEIFRFSRAVIQGEFVWIDLDHSGDVYDGPPQRQRLGVQNTFPRGIDIRISDIVWCADAPDGS